MMPQNSTEFTASPSNTRIPRLVLPGVFAFPSNKDTLGATSYLIVDNIGNILIDCPSWNQANQEFIQSQGGVDYLIISHRGGISKYVDQIQQALDCQIIIQEQEAYLLPEISVTSFADEYSLSSELELIWTPGHSPGSCCLYWQQQGGMLFTGRHLLPKSPTKIVPLRTPKTFHWWRQLNSIAKLRDRFTAEQLQYILPGANTAYLKGQGYIANAYHQLQIIDLNALKHLEP
ncbi:MAG: MBL fold metallo-hydrolase [Cyanobacteria bacterium J06621_8]